MKYKVGDKVKIKEDLIEGNKYNGLAFYNEFIIRPKKEICEIKSITSLGNYRLNDLDFCYNDEMLEPVEENLSDMKYWKNICKIQEEQTQKGLNKYGYPLEKNVWLNAEERLRYLEEELIDGLMYLEHIKAYIKENENE